MNDPRLHVLTLCGSLRTHSVHRAILRAYAQLALPGVLVAHYERMGALPHFNPDLDRDHAPLPDEVEILRGVVRDADAVVISTPEYAHALPGSFKNALDWLVSDPSFPGKPIAIVHVARGSTWALDSLREVLKTMSAQVVEDAIVGLPLTTNQVDETALVQRPDVTALLRHSVAALHRATTRPDAAT